MWDAIRSTVTRFRESSETLLELEQLRAKYAELKGQIDGLYVPIGHFFSPLPNIEEIKSDEARILQISGSRNPCCKRRRKRARYVCQPLTTQSVTSLADWSKVFVKTAIIY